MNYLKIFLVKILYLGYKYLYKLILLKYIINLIKYYQLFLNLMTLLIYYISHDLYKLKFYYYTKKKIYLKLSFFKHFLIIFLIITGIIPLLIIVYLFFFFLKYIFKYLFILLDFFIFYDLSLKYYNIYYNIKINVIFIFEYIPNLLIDIYRYIFKSQWLNYFKKIFINYLKKKKYKYLKKFYKNTDYFILDYLPRFMNDLRDNSEIKYNMFMLSYIRQKKKLKKIFYKYRAIFLIKKYKCRKFFLIKYSYYRKLYKKNYYKLYYKHKQISFYLI